MRRYKVIFLSAYPSAAVFQKNIDMIFVLKMMVKMHDVFVVKCSMQLNFFVDLKLKQDVDHITGDTDKARGR